MAQPSILIYRCLLFFTAGVGALGLAGCERAGPVTYPIPKEEGSADTRPGPAPAQPAPSPGSASPPGGMQILPGMQQDAREAGDILYSVPEGWEEFPSQGIRKANFRVADENGSAEVTILVFAGDAGGELANVNRWAGQLGLEPATAQDLAGISEPYVLSSHSGLFVRLESQRESILGALLPFHGFTWFFKMQGDTATVRAQEAAMKGFLDSIHLEDDNH